MAESTQKLQEPEIGSPEWVKGWMERRVAKRVSKAQSLKD